MMGWWNGILGAAVAATCGCCCGCCCALAQDSGSKIVCGGETVVNATVSRIIDGRTFVLNDGREVRLAAIEVPPLPSPGQSLPAPDKSGQVAASERDAAEHEGKTAKDALDALIGGDQVVLRQADISLPNNLDRYGRIVACAYAQRDGEELFAQGALLESGFARVADRIGNKGCAAELLAGENTVLGPPSLASGAIRIMTCSTPMPLWMCWRSEAVSRWSRARWCPCVKAGPRSI